MPTNSRKNDDQVAAFFIDRPEAYNLFKMVFDVIKSLGEVSVRVSKSQISFSRCRGFAWAWTPDRWLKGGVAPLVVSIALPKKNGSMRWKQVVQPRAGRWMHHLEIRSTDDIDAEVAAWLREAWEDAH
jgi:hypothetical protein